MQRTDKAPRLYSAVVPLTLKQKKSHNADICKNKYFIGELLLQVISEKELNDYILACQRKLSTMH
jgi:hypothetical protein